MLWMPFRYIQVRLAIQTDSPALTLSYASLAYAPQLGATLNLSSTKLNLIGMAGNLGVYISGPFWGKVIDSRGPTRSVPHLHDDPSELAADSSPSEGLCVPPSFYKRLDILSYA
jgi:hypothetical protein